MRKFLLIASVAAFAVTAPAAADRGSRGQDSERAQKAERAKSQGGAQRAERRANVQRRASEQRDTRRQAGFERRTRVQQQASERRAVRQQQVSERRSRVQQAQSDRRSRIEQLRSDRRSRVQQAQSDRRSPVEQLRSDRRSRLQQAQSDRRSRSEQLRSDRRSGVQQARSDRRARIQQEASDRRAFRQQQLSDRRSRRQQIESDRGSRVQQIESDRAIAVGDLRERRERSWERRADRLRVLADRREQLRDRKRTLFRFGDDDDDRRARFFRVGQRVNPSWWYDDYVPVRYSTRFFDDDDFYYRYDGDYIYRLRRDDDIVLALFPLLGGAYSVGRPMPLFYDSHYNVPWGYSSLYYDTPDYYYRYGDGAIYQIDPTTQLIAGIVALLTGQTLGTGQMLPLGYDVYNVPYAYRSTYYDTPDMWYRYDDGYIYGVDPRSRIIQASYPVYGGYAVGHPWPSYAGYDYGVPGYYDDLYYADSQYDYRFASGGIYAVDPKTQLVAALVALVTGQNFAVGQRLPLGYDVYNVPLAYRDRYYDDDDDWYRYADGRIYQVDPGTRLVRRVIVLA